MSHQAAAAAGSSILFRLREQRSEFSTGIAASNPTKYKNLPTNHSTPKYTKSSGLIKVCSRGGSVGLGGRTERSVGPPFCAAGVGATARVVRLFVRGRVHAGVRPVRCPPRGARWQVRQVFSGTQGQKDCCTRSGTPWRPARHLPRQRAGQGVLLVQPH